MLGGILVIDFPQVIIIDVVLLLMILSFVWIVSFLFLIWQLVHGWFGLASIAPEGLTKHFVQFGNLGRTSKQWCTIMHLIWKERNNMIFKNTKSTSLKLIDKIKLLSFWWLKAKYVSFVCGYHN